MGEIYKYLDALSPYFARIRFECAYRYQRIIGRNIEFGRKGSFGKNVRFVGTIRIRSGKGVALRKDVIIAGNGHVVLGDFVTINEGSIISCLERVHIGANTMIAPRVYIIDVDHNFSDPSTLIRLQGYKTSPIIIEEDVWIGTGAVVTRGSHIGQGSVIGANSVVRGYIPPYSVAAGVPARPLKSRLSGRVESPSEDQEKSGEQLRD